MFMPHVKRATCFQMLCPIACKLHESLRQPNAVQQAVQVVQPAQTTSQPVRIVQAAPVQATAAPVRVVQAAPVQATPAPVRVVQAAPVVKKVSPAPVPVVKQTVRPNVVFVNKVALPPPAAAASGAASRCCQERLTE